MNQPLALKALVYLSRWEKHAAACRASVPRCHPSLKRGCKRGTFLRREWLRLRTLALLQHPEVNALPRVEQDPYHVETGLAMAGLEKVNGKIVKGWEP